MIVFLIHNSSKLTTKDLKKDHNVLSCILLCEGDSEIPEMVSFMGILYSG